MVCTAGRRGNRRGLPEWAQAPSSARGSRYCCRAGSGTGQADCPPRAAAFGERGADRGSSDEARGYARRSSAGDGEAPVRREPRPGSVSHGGSGGRAPDGGSLYLANQAKTLASSYRGRLAVAGRESARPGETPFAVPLKLVTTTRGNVRGGPGTNFPIVFAADSGTTLTGYSYLEEWIRISDDGGRGGWIFRTLVSRP